MSALHFACCAGSAEVLTTVLRYNPNINARDIVGRTPIHLAAANGHIHAITTLMGIPGIQVDILSTGNETPLMKAI